MIVSVAGGAEAGASTDDRIPEVGRADRSKRRPLAIAVKRSLVGRISLDM
jgi:hypothetical protein